ncbi:MAG: hypothetical protein NTZ05_03615 [Chloroflexi bacterium]|nr:hypothetical protein [Chloroflexota bacterium]
MISGRRSTDLRPVVRQALQGLHFPRTARDLISFVGMNPESLAARRMLVQLPEVTYHSLEQVLLEVFAFQQRIRERDAQQQTSTPPQRTTPPN